MPDKVEFPTPTEIPLQEHDKDTAPTELTSEEIAAIFEQTKGRPPAREVN